MTVQQLIDVLNVIPAEMRNTEFVVFCSTNGVRVRFPENHVDLSYAMGIDGVMVTLMGKQDENQLS